MEGPHHAYGWYGWLSHSKLPPKRKMWKFDAKALNDWKLQCNLESQRQQPATNCSNSALQSESLWSFPACYVPCLLSLHERIFASVGPHSFGPMVGSMQTLWNCWMLTRQVACFSRTPHKEWNWSGPWWLYCHELNININWMTWSRLKLGNRLHLIHIL